MLEAIAKAENIEISDEKLDEEIGKMAEAYKMEAEMCIRDRYDRYSSYRREGVP